MPTILNEPAPLERYGHNLTILAQQGTFSPLAGEEAVVNRVFQILQRKDKCNPVIIDSDEVRRQRIVAEVTRQMAVGEAPDLLSIRKVIALDYEALFTNLSDDSSIREDLREAYRKRIISPLVERLAQVEPDSEEEWNLLTELFRWPMLEEWIAPTLVLERLQAIFIAMHQAAGSFLLFVDHFHRLLGGERDRYSIDAAVLLKPALARRQIQLIGACTMEQYRQHIERDAAIQRRCQEVCLPVVC